MSLKKKEHSITLRLFVMGVISLLIIFGGKGLIHIYHLSKERDFTKNYNEKIKAENMAMKNETQQLKNDNKYIEMIARKELGMIGKDELFYVLSPSPK